MPGTEHTFEFESDALGEARHSLHCVTVEVSGFIKSTSLDTAEFTIHALWDVGTESELKMSDFPVDEQLKIKTMAQELANEYAQNEYALYESDHGGDDGVRKGDDWD